MKQITGGKMIKYLPQSLFGVFLIGLIIGWVFYSHIRDGLKYIIRKIFGNDREDITR
jgi:hypothetical protein